MKAVKQHLQETKPDRVDAFEKGAQGFAKKLIANFKDYEFYTGENMNPDGMVALLNYREDGVTRTFISTSSELPTLIVTLSKPSSPSGRMVLRRSSSRRPPSALIPSHTGSFGFLSRVFDGVSVVSSVGREVTAFVSTDVTTMDGAHSPPALFHEGDMREHGLTVTCATLLT